MDPPSACHRSRWPLAAPPAALRPYPGKAARPDGGPRWSGRADIAVPPWLCHQLPAEGFSRSPSAPGPRVSEGRSAWSVLQHGEPGMERYINGVKDP